MHYTRYQYPTLICIPNLYTNGERVRVYVRVCVCVSLIFSHGSRNRRKLIFAIQVQGTLIP